MKKLRTVIQYECVTSLKYIGIFYLGIAFFFLIILGILYLVAQETVSVNGLEMNSMIFVGIVGILQIQEEFRMLMQNGFTRTYIFLGTLAQFAFISGLMSLADTVAGNVLHRFLSGHCNFETIFGRLYGYGHPAVLRWLWLFLVYLLICSLFFFCALAINRMPKKISVFICVVIGALVLGVTFLFGAGPWESLKYSIITLAARSFGFMADGTIRLSFPFFLLLLYIGILSACSFLIIRRTEIHDAASKSIFSLK